jgi:hypothetical protein
MLDQESLHTTVVFRGFVLLMNLLRLTHQSFIHLWLTVGRILRGRELMVVKHRLIILNGMTGRRTINETLFDPSNFSSRKD